jgi:hypothetical protein
MRNGSQTTPPSSSALSSETQNSRSRQRSTGTAQGRGNTTTTENYALVAANADDIHSLPLKKARATEKVLALHSRGLHLRWRPKQ